MTQLLEKAIEKLRVLPAEEQDRFAGFLLDELRADHAWDETTRKHSGKLDRLVTSVLEANRRGECDALDPDRM